MTTFSAFELIKLPSFAITSDPCCCAKTGNPSEILSAIFKRSELANFFHLFRSPSNTGSCTNVSPETSKFSKAVFNSAKISV